MPGADRTPETYAGTILGIDIDRLVKKRVIVTAAATRILSDNTNFEPGIADVLCHSAFAEGGECQNRQHG